MINLLDYKNKYLFVITKWRSTDDVVVLPSDSKIIDGRLYISAPVSTQYFKNHVGVDFWGTPTEANSDWLSYEKTRSCGEDDYLNLYLDKYVESLSTRKSEEVGKEYYFDINEVETRSEQIIKDFEIMNEAAREEAIKKWKTS